MKEINVNLLKEYLSYSRDTGLFIWNVNKGPRALKGSEAGSMTSEGYISIQIDGKAYQAHNLAWLYEYGVWPTYQLDHKDRDSSNNRISNLRDVIHNDNCGNKSSNNKIVGAQYSGKSSLKPWTSEIIHKGKKYYLGLFQTAELAGKAYQSALEDIRQGNEPVPTGLRKLGKGYSFSGGKYIANPTINKKQTYLGVFKTEQEAIDAVAKARQES